MYSNIDYTPIAYHYNKLSSLTLIFQRELIKYKKIHWEDWYIQFVGVFPLDNFPFFHTTKTRL